MVLYMSRQGRPFPKKTALIKEIRHLAMAIEGVKDVKVDVKLTDPVD